jgi:hypothetical protein
MSLVVVLEAGDFVAVLDRDREAGAFLVDSLGAIAVESGDEPLSPLLAVGTALDEVLVLALGDELLPCP